MRTGLLVLGGCSSGAWTVERKLQVTPAESSAVLTRRA